MKKDKLQKDIIHTGVLVVGGGAAGMGAILNLKRNDIILVEAPESNSFFSPWNVMIKNKKNLKAEMLKSGGGLNDKRLLRKFLIKKEEVVRDLKKLGIKFKPSNLGVVPDYARPGLKIKEAFAGHIKNNNLKRIVGCVNKFFLNKNNQIFGVGVMIDEEKEIIITFDYLILAAGGISSFFNFSTGEKKVNGSILALCHEAGLEMRDLEFLMFHPFLLTDKRLPRVLVSGDILTKLKFKNEKGEDFLSQKITEALKNNEHHYVFPEMTREFYRQSLKGKILAELTCSSDWFEKYKKENEFGFVFGSLTKQELQDIEISPTFHFLIGGLVINDKAQTNQYNIYAAGEITGGLHGINRIGGTAVAEAWAFGKIAAEDINKKKFKDNQLNNKKFEVVFAREIKSSGISDDLKNKIWQALGPVKNVRSLKNLKKYILTNKKISVEEGLILNMVKICLSRKGSIGSFYREDLSLVSKAKSLHVFNKKIFLK